MKTFLIMVNIHRDQLLKVLFLYLVFNKIKDVKMDGQVGRYTNPKSHFPSFMQVLFHNLEKYD